MPKSTHLPEVSGGTAAVTGTLVVDTELRDLVAFVATQMTDVAANEESNITWELVTQESGTTQKVTIKVTKGGTNHATAGDSAVTVSWLALGQ